MPAGRPLELTSQLIADAVALIPRTLYVETVADSLGIHRDTFREWVRIGAREQRRRDRGKEPRRELDLHCEFSVSVKRAIAETEADHLSQIQAAGTESWQALAWVLERRFLGKWSLNRAEVRELKRRLDELEKSHAARPTEPQGRASRKPRTAEAAR